MQHTFQEEVRRALTKYALMPVLILAVLGSLLMLFSWKHYVTGTNHEQRAVVAEVMQGIFADYWQRTERAVATLETSADLTLWQTDPQKKLRAQIDYAKFRRRHKHCFDCIYMKAVFMDVVCTNPEMKSKVPKGEK